MSLKSFFRAFSDRYLDTGDLDLEELTIRGKQKYTKDLVVELVGREKAVDTFRDVQNLRQIVLSDSFICCVDDETLSESEQVANEKLRSNLQKNNKIKSLDISYNQLNSWIEIVRIVELFPSLEELIITGNPFESIDLTDLDWQIKVLNNVRNLVAGKLKINWSSIESFDKIFVNLKYLNIFNNRLNTLQLNDSSSFINLEYLSLSENQIGWSNVLNLKQLHNLKHLQLDNCRIETIQLDDSCLFTNLKQLNLSNNLLNKWSDISELNKFTSLIDLSTRDNLLFKDQDHDAIFNFTVAILKNLKVLNKQIINAEKRLECEIYFLRTNFKAWLTGQLKDWNVDRRFNELIDHYGKPIDLLTDVQVNKFSVINLTDSQRSFKKKVLKSMSIGALRMLVQRLFNLPNQTDFDLCFLNDNDKSIEFKFDQDNRDLEFYPISENFTIQVITRN